MNPREHEYTRTQKIIQTPGYVTMVSLHKVLVVPLEVRTIAMELTIHPQNLDTLQ